MGTTDYVRPTGHNYEDTVVEATEDTVGYTFHRCTECEYSYLSDFVRSGEQPTFPDEENPVIEPEQPDEPSEPETPVNPDEPSEPETPDEPSEPTGGDEQGEHTHNYFLYSERHDDEKYVFIQYVCPECEVVKNEIVQITFTSEDGNRFDLTADENGKVSYADIPAGTYSVEMFNDEGQTLTWYEMTIEEAEQPIDEPTEPSEPTEPIEQPDEPSEPSEPTEPEQPDEPSETDTPSEPEQPIDTEKEPEKHAEETTEKVEKKGNAGLFIGLAVALFVLGAGGVTTLIILKKKNKNKNKEEK